MLQKLPVDWRASAVRGEEARRSVVDTSVDSRVA